MPEYLLLAAGQIERDDDFLERDAGGLHGDPRPQRPGGVVLVADHEGQGHAGLLSTLLVRCLARRQARCTCGQSTSSSANSHGSAIAASRQCVQAGSAATATM